MQPATLTPELLLHAVGQLAARDDDLAQIAARLGPPPLWARTPGFPTMLHIILEQQVSLASAQAAFNRLSSLAAPLTPARFLELSDDELKGAGFSRQKTRYGRELALAVVEGRINLDELERLEDGEVERRLTALKGIGPWSANIYLLMALGRPDIWPPHDLALAVAAQRVKRLSARPANDDLRRMAEGWRPWRAVAARLLWHDYLSRATVKKTGEA